MSRVSRWLIAAALLLGPDPLDLNLPGIPMGTAMSTAQQVSAPAPAVPAPPGADPDAVNRALVLGALGRAEVRHAARAAGLDLARVEAGVRALEGEPLARAARQVEALDRRLAIDGTISSTTLILLLVLTILIIVAIQAS